MLIVFIVVIEDIFPIDVSEERMVHDFLDASTSAESVRRVLLEEALDQIKARTGELLQGQRLPQDVLLHLVLVIVVVRWQARDQLIKQNTQTVIVNRAIVWHVLKDLGAKVLWTPANSLRLAILREVLLRKAKVGQL